VRVIRPPQIIAVNDREALCSFIRRVKVTRRGLVGQAANPFYQNLTEERRFWRVERIYRACDSES